MHSMRPFHQIICQNVLATIWHETNNGHIRFNVALSKQPNSGEHAFDSAYFQKDDMLVLGEIGRAVHSWIVDQSLEPVAADEQA